MAWKRRKAEPAKPEVLHGRSCICKGSGVIPGAPFTAENGMTYTKVSSRCPGVKPWESPGTPTGTSAGQTRDGKAEAAGEGGGDR